MKKNKKTETVVVKVTSKERTTWGSFNPVTRVPANPRAYNRNTEKKNIRKEVKCYV